jgi:VWFA-related protein
MYRPIRSNSIAALLLSASVGFGYQTAGPIGASDPRPRSTAIETPAPAPYLRVDSSLVLIPVQVSTDSGAPVTQLAKESFHIFEDGVEQKITHFGKDDAPISIGVLFDSSGSMQNKMRKSLEAASTFFKTANPGDEFFLINFNQRPKLAVGFTPDSEELYRRISQTHPFGRTSLFDAIEMAVRQMKKAKNQRKAIVILSDGGDNSSRMTFKSVKSLMQEADVQMYSMGIFDPSDSPKRPREEQEGPRLLDELTGLTGGRNYRVDNLDDLPDISARIGRLLRNQYMIGYTPGNEGRDGKYRRVKLLLDTSAVDKSTLDQYTLAQWALDKLAVGAAAAAPALRVQYRTGYYAPVE